jgi:predicted nucleic acid-binding protein
VTVFFDTAVVMYAAGGPHTMQRPSRELIDAVADGRLDATVSAEVVQEILHRFSASGRRDIGTAMAEATLDLFSPVLPITDRIMRRMPTLFAEYEELSARDLVHVAACREVGIEIIVSPDRGFDQVEGLQRLDPTEALNALL